MIVICTGCQARFRVADEKVGPRGAKVRCSKCQTIFVVKRQEAPEPAAAPIPEAPSPRPSLELDLTPGLPHPSPLTDPGFTPPGASVIQFPGLSSPSSGAALDPFAAAGLEALAEAHGPEPSADPFAAMAQSLVAVRARHAAGGSESHAVTDLSHLLGAGDPFPAPSPSPAPVPAPPAPDPAELAALRDLSSDLALEDGSSAGRAAAPFADPSDVFMSGEEPASLGNAAFELGGQAGLEFGPSGPLVSRDEPSLALATEPTPGPDRGSTALPVAEAPAPPPRPAAQASARAAAGPPAEQEPAPAEKVRRAAVSALALVALLAIALAFRVVMRGQVALGPSALRPSTMLRALFGGSAPTATFEVEGVRSGLYEQGDGRTVLFVQGEVVSRAPGPVPQVRVEAELVRGGQVVARGEGLAGAVPTAEELFAAQDPTALDTLAGEVRKRAPGQVKPGERLAFRITMGDAPADLARVSVRVRAGQPAEGNER